MDPTTQRLQSILDQLPEEVRPDLPPLVDLLRRVEGQLHTRDGAATAVTDAAETTLEVDQLRDASERAGLVTDGGAFTRMFDRELQATIERLERTGDRRPLAGVPFAVKDLIAVAGHPIGAGSAVREHAPPEPVDASIVRLLRGLGAVPIGLTALHEFAFGVTGLNPHTGTPPNPAGAGRVPGGSSSGSAAAVADRVVPFALGTDTGGSVRIPAALCGVVGYKPSFRLYPTAGVFPLSPSLDHVGLIADELDTVIRVHRALGFELQPEMSVRAIGVARGAVDAADEHVSSRIEEALDAVRRTGVEVMDVDWPEGEDVFAVSTAIMFSEAATVHQHDLRDRPDRYGADVRARLVQGSAIPATTYLAARQHQDVLRRRAADILGQVEVVVGPTVGRVAPTVDEAAGPEVAAQLVRNTRLANVTGHPAVTLPVPGVGLPVGIQVTADSDVRLLAAAGQLAASWSS